MDRIQIDQKINELETSIEKATYIIQDLFSEYGITDITKPSDQEKKIYAFSCGKIYNYIAITNDYITESRKLLKEMKEMV
jgi:hypothetical protein